MEINKTNILNKYDEFKNIAIKSRLRGNLNKSLAFTTAAANLANKYNFRYCDDELEDNIIQIANFCINTRLSFNPTKNKIVFFDSFSIDNRGLTQQYLRAVFSWNAEILYITSKEKVGDDIYKELKAYGKCKIITIKKNSFTNNLNYLIDKVVEYKPEISFLHFSGADIIGVALWSKIIDSKRYMINLADHAFWLGKRCLDYCVEFREYGIYLSVNERNISAGKILLQPYYPIESKVPFLGFPIETKNKIIAFAGATYYKIYGEDFLLLNLLKEVLLENDNFIFLYAGSGDDKPFKDFIKNNELQSKILLLGNRRDISEVIKNIDIYINTYPMIGGLMSQFAAKYNKPIIGYSDPKLYSFNDTEDLLGLERNNLIVKDTTEAFIAQLNNLINDIKLRIENIKYTNNSILTEKEFNSNLHKTIFKSQNPLQIKSKNVIFDRERIFDLYIDIDKNYLKSYNHTLYSSLKKYFFYYSPISYCKFVIIHFIKKYMYK